MNTPTNNNSMNSSVARQQQLRRYVHAGAGAAVLAGAVTTADAAVVFVNYNNQIFADTTPNDMTSTFFNFDINGDGINDFRLRHRIDSSFLALARIRNPVGGSVDVIGLTSGNFAYASRLASNFTVGGAGPFVTLSSAGFYSGSMAFASGYSNSQWVSPNGISGFLGLRFHAADGDHYAYVKLTVLGSTNAQPYAFQIAGIGYETTPNTPIMTGAVPEPASLSLLALGAAGLIGYRRMKAAKANKA